MKTIFIVFWVTWDLSKRKIFPALYEIYKKNNKKIEIIWTWRRNFSNKDIRNFLKEQTKKFIKEQEYFDNFLKQVSYSKVELWDEEHYKKLQQNIDSIYKEDTQIIIYLSIAPKYFWTFIENSKHLNLDKNSKIIFEKPFWTNLKTAIELNNKINQIFDEKQIYRIDHYLGKQAVQNLLTLKFSNPIFNSIWDNKHISNIQIIASEKVWLEWRAWYYEQSWALKDMIQNHILQILTLLSMDKPKNLESSEIATEKLKVLKYIQKINDFKNNVVFWQYEWYKNEEWVDKNSENETFVALKLEVKNKKMSWIPFYIKTWKNLDKKLTRIVIVFKNNEDQLFPSKNHKNKIIIDIHNWNQIKIEFNIKDLNNKTKINSTIAQTQENIEQKEAYEQLINDVINSDKTLFTTFDILKRSWEIIDDLVNCKDNCPYLHKYEIWSKWPKAYLYLTAKNEDDRYD